MTPQQVLDALIAAGIVVDPTVAALIAGTSTGADAVWVAGIAYGPEQVTAALQAQGLVDPYSAPAEAFTEITGKEVREALDSSLVEVGRLTGEEVRERPDPRRRQVSSGEDRIRVGGPADIQARLRTNELILNQFGEVVDPATGQVIADADRVAELADDDPFFEPLLPPRLPPDRRLIGGFPEDFEADLPVTPPGRIPGFDDRGAAPSQIQAIIDASPGTVLLTDAPTIGGTRHLPGAGYREGEQWSLFTGLSTEQKASLQSEFVKAGLLGDGDYSPGTWDPASARAAETLLLMSNANNRKWDHMLRRLVANPVGSAADQSSQVRRFVAPAYVEPDYATLTQAVKQEFGRQLGRRPQEWEIGILADELAADARRAYQATVSKLRAEHDAGNRAIAEGVDTSAGTVQGVDPEARFREKFEERYLPEIERQERVESFGRQRNLLLQSFLVGADASGGILR
jgi:hypothetical protein